MTLITIYIFLNYGFILPILVCQIGSNWIKNEILRNDYILECKQGDGSIVDGERCEFLINSRTLHKCGWHTGNRSDNT